MKRRIRKKLRLPEFQELGFEIEFEYSDETVPDEFVYSLIDGESLLFGGGEGRGKCQGFVTAERRSVTVSEQRTVERWLSSNPHVSKYSVGQLRDAWYGWDC